MIKLAFLQNADEKVVHNRCDKGMCHYKLGFFSVHNTVKVGSAREM